MNHGPETPADGATAHVSWRSRAVALVALLAPAAMVLAAIVALAAARSVALTSENLGALLRVAAGR